jgi:hypothetical protein
MQKARGGCPVGGAAGIFGYDKPQWRSRNRRLISGIADVAAQGSGGYMKILSFKFGGSYLYNVGFETISEKQKIETDEEPIGSLLTAMGNTVSAALDCFFTEKMTAKFRQITYYYPENGIDEFVLEMGLESSSYGYTVNVLKSDRIKMYQQETGVNTNFDFSKNILKGNKLVDCVENLREEIIKYIQGEREQKELPFDETQDDEAGEDGASLFGDETA